MLVRGGAGFEGRVNQPSVRDSPLGGGAGRRPGASVPLLRQTKRKHQVDLRRSAPASSQGVDGVVPLKLPMMVTGASSAARGQR